MAVKSGESSVELIPVEKAELTLEWLSLFPRHIPDSLPHREYHMRMLRDLFMDFLKKPGQTYQRIVQILGPIGSGKSCTAYRFGIEFEKESTRRGIPLKVVHVSCKLGVDSRYVLYQTVLQKLAPENVTRGYSENEMLRQIINKHSRRFSLGSHF